MTQLNQPMRLIDWTYGGDNVRVVCFTNSVFMALGTKYLKEADVFLEAPQI